MVGGNSMSFMFETAYMIKLSDYAMKEKNIDTEYYKCWQNLPKQFNPAKC